LLSSSGLRIAPLRRLRGIDSDDSQDPVTIDSLTHPANDDMKRPAMGLSRNKATGASRIIGIGLNDFSTAVSRSKCNG
jgi:hypothetical protein